MFERRCCSCNHLIGKGQILAGKLEVKCLKCGTLNTIIAEPPKELPKPERHTFAHRL